MTSVLVVGGGIGGLATALSAAKAGCRVVVLERNDDFTELGAGVQLAPNAFHALDLLGVGEEVRALAVHIDELRFMDGVTGEQVVSMALTDDYRARFGNPYAVVRRSDLYQPLLRACRESAAVELRSASPVASYEQDVDGVTAVLRGGERLRADVLVGADGIRSTIRRQLIGDGEPRASGHTIYRSVIPMEQVPEDLRWNTVTLWAGPMWHFVHYPIGSGRFLNLAVIRDNNATRVVSGDPVERSVVLGQFPDLGDTARRLLELGSDWRTWLLCDREPVDTWHDGRVALLGDAAHPMLQYAAQGACMALEDAVVLGRVMSGEDIPERLREYCVLRRERTAFAQRVSREMGTEVYHLEGPDAVARNAMLSALSVEDLYDKLSRLHGATDFTEWRFAEVDATQRPVRRS